MPFTSALIHKKGTIMYRSYERVLHVLVTRIGQLLKHASMKDTLVPPNVRTRIPYKSGSWQSLFWYVIPLS